MPYNVTVTVFKSIPSLSISTRLCGHTQERVLFYVLGTGPGLFAVQLPGHRKHQHLSRATTTLDDALYPPALARPHSLMHR
jgi:hypothetical protein